MQSTDSRDISANNFANAAARVRILPVKFISGGSGSTSNAIAALNYAASRGAKVMNCSWGAGGATAYSQALYDTIVGIYNSDVVISVAAGNNGTNNDSNPYFPAGYNIPSLLSVGSLTADHSGSSPAIGRSYFSNYGPNTVDVMAVGSMKDTFGNTGGVWSSYSSYLTSGSYWVKSQGTSMAAPLVAGVAGVIRALNGNLNNYDVKNRIINTGTAAADSSGTKSGRRINALAAFSGVAYAASGGGRPRISGPAYFGKADVQEDSAGQESTKKIGGCGLVSSVGGSVPPAGPMGGNSMGLVTLAYCLFLASKKLLSAKPAKQRT
jgi:subtilisin family serine protease